MIKIILFIIIIKINITELFKFFVKIKIRNKTFFQYNFNFNYYYQKLIVFYALQTFFCYFFVSNLNLFKGKNKFFFLLLLISN